MKKVNLLACLLALALSASAQNHRPVSPNAIRPNAIGPNARGVSANAEGVTTIQPAAAAKTAPSGGSQGPPVKKVPPNAVGPNAAGPTATK